jgi:hypothetical protein
VLIDATLIRAVLLPASMKLLGEANWYLPRWLECCPHSRTSKPSASMQRPGSRSRRSGRLVGASAESTVEAPTFGHCLAS